MLIDPNVQAAISAFDPLDAPWIPAEMHPSIAGLMDNNVPLAAVEDAASGTRWLAAIKPVQNGGAREIFASEIAKAANMGSMVGEVHRLPGGGAAIPFVSGSTLDELGILDGDDLFDALRSRYGTTLAATEATEHAVNDMSRMLAFDATVGVRDRWSANALLAPDLRLIDHAAMFESDTYSHVKIDRRFLPLHGQLIDGRPFERIPVQRLPTPPPAMQHVDLPIPSAIAAEFGNVTHERLAQSFAIASADDATIAARMLDDVVARASWIAEHARVPVMMMTRR
jgi:hypothetical protein